MVGFHLTRLLHNRQIESKCSRLSTERFKRSAFGLVAFYNALPQWLVEVCCTNTFQRVVQRAVMRTSRSGTSWYLWIREGWKQMSCNQFDAAFSKSDARESNSRHAHFEEFVDGESTSESE